MRRVYTRYYWPLVVTAAEAEALIRRSWRVDPMAVEIKASGRPIPPPRLRQQGASSGILHELVQLGGANMGMGLCTVRG